MAPEQTQGLDALALSIPLLDGAVPAAAPQVLAPHQHATHAPRVPRQRLQAIAPGRGNERQCGAVVLEVVKPPTSAQKSPSQGWSYAKEKVVQHIQLAARQHQSRFGTERHRMEHTRHAPFVPPFDGQVVAAAPQAVPPRGEAEHGAGVAPQRPGHGFTSGRQRRTSHTPERDFGLPFSCLTTFQHQTGPLSVWKKFS